GLVFLVLALTLSCCLRHLRVREVGPAVGQPFDRLDELTSAEKHLEIDRTMAALAATATVENFLPWVDGEAIVAGAADRTSTDEFDAGLTKLGAMRPRDRDHVDGPRLIDQRVPLVAVHAVVCFDPFAQVLYGEAPKFNDALAVSC